MRNGLRGGSRSAPFLLLLLPLPGSRLRAAGRAVRGVRIQIAASLRRFCLPTAALFPARPGECTSEAAGLAAIALVMGAFIFTKPLKSSFSGEEREWG